MLPAILKLCILTIQLSTKFMNSILLSQSTLYYLQLTQHTMTSLKFSYFILFPVSSGLVINLISFNLQAVIIWWTHPFY